MSDFKFCTENCVINRRLKHLLKSRYIRQFDEKDPHTRKYKLPIEEADRLCMRTDLRPCTVNGTPGYFHRWVQHSEIIPPSPLNGSHQGGQLQYITALVELEDGSLGEFMLRGNDIRFTDREVPQ